MNPDSEKHILVVDDDPYVLESVSLLLNKSDYTVVTCGHPKEAIDKLQTTRIDAVLTDIKMPQISGIELLEQIRAFNMEIPVLLMTAYAELDTAIDAIKKGAFDFIIKPFGAQYLVHSIEKAVAYSRLRQMEKDYKHTLEDTVRKKTQELADALMTVKNVSKETIRRLASAAESRDTETGAHILRMGLYAKKIAGVMNMPTEFVETITFASLMHDIGKIGIPDSILLKTGLLTFEEFQIMKAHTTIGKKILASSSHYSIQMSASVALNHHEKWDGSGYPSGLKGEDIPIEGRIVIICDQYDSLRSKRPYKTALGHHETFEIITKGDDRTKPWHFCPKVLKTFIDIAPAFDEIFSMEKIEAVEFYI